MAARKAFAFTARPPEPQWTRSGVLVSADQTEPQVVQEDQLREMYGLARVSTETKVRIKEVCSALRVLAG